MDIAASQRHRLNRAVNFAFSNLSEPMDLRDLADTACLSKFHFCRAFKSHFKETPFEFLWRIRIENAARRLIFAKEKSITEVSIESGFSCLQSFSQAFHRKYQLSPRRFKQIDTLDFHLFSPSAPQSEVINRLNIALPAFGPRDLPVRIEKRPGYNLAYVRHYGSYGDLDGGISGAFRRLEIWARTKNLSFERREWIGLCPDSPTLTPPHLCMYDAATPVPEHLTEDATVSIRKIPGGTYAVLEVPRNLRLLNTWQWFVSVWLPHSGRTYGQRPCYEYMPGGPESSIHLCQPIGP